MDMRKYGGTGCILADDMARALSRSTACVGRSNRSPLPQGLGKTLQAITLLWTLLRQGFDGQPAAKRVIIVCPTSLVSNWDAECEKWLKGRVRTLPIAEATRADVISSIGAFLAHRRDSAQVLIISYETFRLHAERFKSPAACDLLICDEAHRLKNDATLTNQALDSLACRRRVLLSGTPIQVGPACCRWDRAARLTLAIAAQNHLDEFFAMVNFANPARPPLTASLLACPLTPGRAGRAGHPPRVPQEVRAAHPGRPRAGLERGAADKGRGALARAERGCGQVHPAAHQQPAVRAPAPEGDPDRVLPAVRAAERDVQRGALLQAGQAHRQRQGDEGAEHHPGPEEAVQPPEAHLRLGGERQGEGRLRGAVRLHEVHPAGACLLAPRTRRAHAPRPRQGLFDDGRAGRGAPSANWPEHGRVTLLSFLSLAHSLCSGKFLVLAELLGWLRRNTTDRIVLVSNYTQTLDLFAALCKERNYPFLRLDGSVSISKRQTLVKKFNDLADRQFAFLLSSKAGGCGLNLIGGNRLVLFDPDWRARSQRTHPLLWP
jgi:DNA repair and recombination RAD54-like protein